MYDTSGTHSVCDAAPSDNNVAMRIAWLDSQVAYVESGAAAAQEREWRRALSIVNPVSTEDAYAKFGLCLGLFPPFAIFARILLSTWHGGGADFKFFGSLFLGMNVICGVVGWCFAGHLGRKMGDPRARGWGEHVGDSFVRAMVWALVTGGLGGFLGFGFGAVVGVAFAMPVALAAFPVFAALHRAQSHGGMIEERDLRTIAYGIPLTAAALIMTVGR